MTLFKNRLDAGIHLAKALKQFQLARDTLVLGLARGGVVVAYEVANQLQLPLDVVVPRKISAPHNPELAIGAISEDGEIYLDKGIVELTGATSDFIEKEVQKEKQEAERRILLYRGKETKLSTENKRVILVDDGIATGSTMLAVVRSMRASGAIEIIVAVPVASNESLELLDNEADTIVCLYVPTYFGAVGYFYDTFDQTNDDEVIHLLHNVGRKIKIGES